MRIRPNWSLILGGEGHYVKRKEERKEEKKKKKKRKGMETRDLYGDVWISMILYGY